MSMSDRIPGDADSMDALIDAFNGTKPTIYDFEEDGEWYYNICPNCAIKFLGYKRRIICKKCEYERNTP